MDLTEVKSMCGGGSRISAGRGVGHDRSTNQVVGSPIPTGDDPEPVAITPDGSRVGRYALVMTARDTGGVASAPRRLSFTIVKR